MNNWISVKDKLPKYTGLYLVCCDIGSEIGGHTEVRAYEYRIINIKEKIVEGWDIPENWNEIVTVAHWMELPEPPKK